MLGRVLSSFTFRRPSVDVLTFDDEPLKIDTLIPIHSSRNSLRGLFSHKLCQEDHLDPIDANYWESPDEDTNLAKRRLPYLQPASQRKSSFERLLELMLKQNIDKSAQVPDEEYFTTLPPNISEIHATLEQQLHKLNDLIERKTIQTMRALNYPIASGKIDKVLEQDPVGFTDALCFVINVAVKHIITDIAECRASLGTPDVELLRKKFYKLTSTIESVRKTRVRVFSQFNKDIAIPLESTVNTTGVHDEERLTNGLYVPTVPRQKYMKDIFDDNSFESIFWSNYSSIMKQLVVDSSKYSKDTANDQVLELRWEAWKRENIICRASEKELFELSSADMHTQLRIVSVMLDVAIQNFNNAEKCLKTATDDFQEGRKIFREFLAKIRVSTLNPAEVSEILKVIQVAAATAITFLKNIEKTTRMSRLFISESIYQLRSVLGQMKDKKPKEFVYKPRYIALSFTVNYNHELLQARERLTEPLMAVEEKPLVELFASSPPGAALTQAKSDFINTENESTRAKRFYSDTTLIQADPGMAIAGSKSEEGVCTATNAKTPINSGSMSRRLKSAMIFWVKDIEFLRLGLDQELLDMEVTVSDRLRQAHVALTFPSAAAWPEDGKIPFILGLCSVLVEMALQTGPYRQITSHYQHAILNKMKEFQKATSLGNDKKDYVKLLARELSSTSLHLDWLSKLLLINRKDLKNEISYNQNMCADAQSLAEKIRLRTRAVTWQIRWADKREGILLRYAEDTLKTINFASLKLHMKCELVISLLQYATHLYNEAGAHIGAAELDLQNVNKSLRSKEKKLKNYFKKHTVTMEELQYYGMRAGKVKAAHTQAVELLGKLNTTMSQVASIMFVLSAYFGSHSVLEKMRLNPGGNSKDRGRIRQATMIKLSQAEDFLRGIYTVPLAIYAPLKIKPKHVGL